jgi:flagellar basal-body rod modification protein FlgD
VDINALLGAGSSTGSSSASTEAAGDLGRDEFLQMLITQLENQDPLNPQDATEFTAQLAQFSSLDQLFSMRSAIDKLATVQGSTNALSVASLIGRRVTVETTAFDVPAAGGTLPQLALESASAGAILGGELRDSTGRLVAQLGPRTLAAGRNAVAWADLGGAPPAGAYQLRVTPAAGSASPAVLVDAPVTGATFTGGAATLLLGTQPVSLDRLRDVRE